MTRSGSKGRTYEKYLPKAAGTFLQRAKGSA